MARTTRQPADETADSGLASSNDGSPPTHTLTDEALPGWPALYGRNLTLQVTFELDIAGSHNMGTNEATARIEWYDGSTWTPLGGMSLADQDFNGAQSFDSTVSVDLNTDMDLSLFKIRAFAEATSTIGDNADAQAKVTDWELRYSAANAGVMGA